MLYYYHFSAIWIQMHALPTYITRMRLTDDRRLASEPAPVSYAVLSPEESGWLRERHFVNGIKILIVATDIDNRNDPTAAFTDLLAAVQVLVTRWTGKLTDFNNAMTAYPALPAGTSDADRFTFLQTAEQLVTSKLDPLPATPAMLFAALPAKGAAMQARLGQFQALQAGAGTSFANLLSAISALSTAEFDSQPFDVSSIGDRAVIVAEDVSRILNSQLSVAQARITSVNAQLTAAAAAARRPIR